MSKSKNERDEHDALVKAFLKSFGIECDSKGYQQSPTRCAQCGSQLWVKCKIAPFRWESDINIYTYMYECRTCNSHWHEFDSE